jgi:hypothetical protein
MDSLRNTMLWLSLLVLALIMTTGCTKKNNLTGNNWSDTHALESNDKTGLISGYSFPAETLSKTSGSEIKLLTLDRAACVFNPGNF